MTPIGKTILEKNIILDTSDPAIQGGFTQVPNHILEDPDLSERAKLVYALFLRYAWENDFCFPGQETLAEHMGRSVSAVSKAITELKDAGYIEIKRPGQGKVNTYTLKFNVQREWRAKRAKGGDKRRSGNS